jgi:hypothetical protein
VPRGDGHAVLVLPGLLAGDFSTVPLRRFLRTLCYDARGWKLGINRGPRSGLREQLRKRLLYLADRHGRPVSLVGWSLGGDLRPRAGAGASGARPARDHAGNPVSRHLGEPRGTPGTDPAGRTSAPRGARAAGRPPPSAARAEHLHLQSDRRHRGLAELREQPGPQRESIEVECSHTGMGFHPDVLKVIADRLAQPRGDWRPYPREATS